MLMADDGVETSVHYPPVHRFDTYRSARTALPRTEFVADHEITLPMYGSLTRTQVDRVCDTIQRALDHSKYPN